jgi:hypothetical protein
VRHRAAEGGQLAGALALDEGFERFPRRCRFLHHPVIMASSDGSEPSNPTGCGAEGEVPYVVVRGCPTLEKSEGWGSLAVSEWTRQIKGGPYLPSLDASSPRTLEESLRDD